MSDQIYKQVPGEQVPVEPVGTLATSGYLPGTWVAYSTTTVSGVSGAVAAVDLSDGTGVLAGFLLTGSQFSNPVQLESDMWTTDTRQRAGGDSSFDFYGVDGGASFHFDGAFDNGLLQSMGSRICTMIVAPTGWYRFYVYETENLAERTTPGSGAALTYSPGDKLYVSNRGRLTKEQESGSHSWCGYVVANTGTDEQGDFIYPIAAMG